MTICKKRKGGVVTPRASCGKSHSRSQADPEFCPEYSFLHSPTTFTTLESGISKASSLYFMDGTCALSNVRAGKASKWRARGNRTKPWPPTSCGRTQAKRSL